jgi:hypothetical protein
MCRPYPVDRFSQVLIISIATVVGVGFGAAGIAARRHLPNEGTPRRRVVGQSDERTA